MKRASTGCEHCGQPLVRGKRGPAPRYCSASCRARACTERAKADGRFAKWNATSAARRRTPPVWKECPYCLETFQTTRPANDVTCGSEHCRKAHQARRVRPYVNHRKRVVRAGEDFAKAEIFDRDNWQCGICGDAVDADLEWPHPLSASVDHVVPLAHGGKHVRTNVRCTHLICNHRRGVRDDSELSLVPPAQAAR